jgi:hypothetical protein
MVCAICAMRTAPVSNVINEGWKIAENVRLLFMPPGMVNDQRWQSSIPYIHKVLTLAEIREPNLWPSELKSIFHQVFSSKKDTIRQMQYVFPLFWYRLPTVACPLAETSMINDMYSCLFFLVLNTCWTRVTNIRFNFISFP